MDFLKIRISEIDNRFRYVIVCKDQLGRRPWTLVADWCYRLFLPENLILTRTQGSLAPNYMLNHRVVLNNRVLRLSKSNVCEVLCKHSLCNIDLAKYITTTGNSCFRLGEIKQIYSETTSPNENLVQIIYSQTCIKTSP